MEGWFRQPLIVLEGGGGVDVRASLYVRGLTPVPFFIVANVSRKETNILSVLFYARD